MKKFIIVLSFIICNCLLYSQIRQILVLNEGAFDYVNNKILVPVTTGSFQPGKGIYTHLNEISDARFASDIILDGNSYWVAADKYLLKFNLNTHQKEAEHFIEGIRKIAIYKNLIIVTRGEYLKTLSSYVQIFDKNTFSLLFEIPFNTLPYAAESIVVLGEIAFVAVNNGFDFGKEVGKIVKINLKDLEVLEVIELGKEGNNPENLMVKDNVLISLNNRDFTGSSVSLINAGNSMVSTYRLTNVNSLCGTSTLISDRVVYQEIGKTELGEFNIATQISGFLKDLGKSFYGMSYDPKSGYLCAAETDFRTTGKVLVYDEQLNEVYKFDAGIAPGYFAFDDASIVTNEDPEGIELAISPNPISTKFRILSNYVLDEVKILDLYGRELLQCNKSIIDLSLFKPGYYILTATSGQKTAYKSICKM